jgi:2-polyprenyl-3-methyl-5-hydroxy-6-metoxy-1,4-benzoquinol methylase
VPASWNPEQPEISDLIVRHNPLTLKRESVRKQDVLEVFQRSCNRQAVRAVEKLPDWDGVLVDAAVDRTMLGVHWEMQRLAEEFYHGYRIWELLRTIVAALRTSGSLSKLRIVDVGCGIGYAPRWLAARVAAREQGLEFLGVDLNSALIREASRLAQAEDLDCKFFQGDAFSPQLAGNIIISTGVIHHFRGPELEKFLQRHEREETQAFFHFDFQPWLLAPVGSWFFHQLRMRTAIARHDGVLSAARAHSAKTLVEAARKAAPGFASGIYGARIWNTPAPRVFHTLVGIRRPLVTEFRTQLGRRRGRLGDLQ